MNKKVIGIVVGVLIFAVIGIAVLKKKGIEPVEGLRAISKSGLAVESPARYLPQNTVMFYSLANLESVWTDIRKSNFWNKASGLRVWSDFGIKENWGKLLATLEEKVGMEITESRVLDVLGKQVTFAVVLEPGSSDVKILLQAYVGKMTQFVEGMLRSLVETSEGGGQKSEYSGETIVTLGKSSETTPEVRYVMVNNILTFAFGKAESELKTAVDLIKGQKKECLGNHAVFLDAQEILGGVGEYTSLFFSDFSKVSGVLGDILKPLMEAQPEQFAGLNLEEVNKNLEQLKLICGKAFLAPEGLKIKTFVLPDFSKMTSERKKSWEQKDSVLQSVRFAPEDTLMMNASANLDAKAIWDSVMASPGEEAEGGAMGGIADFLAGLKDFEATYNLNIKNDIVDLLGEEMAFVFSGINLEGPFPIPRLGFILQSGDAKKLYQNFKGVLEKVFSGPESFFPMNFQTNNVLGSEITVMGTPMGEGLSPVFGSVDSWFFIATNAKTAEKYLESYKAKGKISGNKSYQNLFSKGTESGAQKSFADLKGLNQMVLDLTNWVLQRNLIPQTGGMQDVSANISTYALPALECLKALDSFGFSSYKEKDMAVQDVTLVVKDL